MLIIGVCGTSGSGKGYVCKKFEKHGVYHIDTDKVYRECSLKSAECQKELTDYFGNDIFDNGLLNSRVLAARVFEGEGKEQRLNMLNSITHKYIKIDTERIIDECRKGGYSAVLVDAPVLFESGFDGMCDATICITAPYEMKVERIMKRDGITREKAEARLKTQLSDNELRQRCTYEIDNTDGCDTDSQIISVLKGLKIKGL